MMPMRSSTSFRVSVALRVGAGLCAVLWVVGLALGDSSRVCGCLNPPRVCAGEVASSHHGPTAAAALESQAHETGHCDGCQGKKDCSDIPCPSVIQAFLTATQPVVILKTISQPTLYGFCLNLARERVAPDLLSERGRQAKPRDWVFTPEVYLGPGLRSLAPPASS